MTNATTAAALLALHQQEECGCFGYNCAEEQQLFHAARMAAELEGLVLEPHARGCRPLSLYRPPEGAIDANGRVDMNKVFDPEHCVVRFAYYTRTRSAVSAADLSEIWQ